MPQTLQSPRNNQIDEETILKRYDSLPDDLKEALMDVSTADAIYEIGRKANLDVEKIGLLAEEIGLIILGFIPSENFISDLKRVLEIGEEKASSVALEVNDRIFLPIRESLKRIHGAAWAEGITRTPLKTLGPVVVEKKPAPPIAEIKPEATAKPLARTEEKIPQAPFRPPPAPAPKEPLLIRPMGGVPGAPITKEPFVKAMQQPTTLPPAPPPIPRIPAPAVKPPEKTAPPPPTRGLTAEKKPFEIRPPGFPYQPPRPPEVKTHLAPAAKSLTPPLPEVKFPPPPAVSKTFETIKVPPPPKLPVEEKPATAQPKHPPQENAAPQGASLTPAEREARSIKLSGKIQVPPPPPRQAGLDPYREPVE